MQTNDKVRSPKALDIEIGQMIRARRIMAGLTQEKIADACGVTFQQVQKYETGRNRVSVSRLKQIADALDLSPAYFFSKADPVSDDISARALRCAGYINALPDELQRYVGQMLYYISRREGA